jgi:hypothetical protein
MVLAFVSTSRAALLGALMAAIMQPDDAQSDGSGDDEAELGVGAEYQAIHAPVRVHRQTKREALLGKYEYECLCACVCELSVVRGQADFHAWLRRMYA